MSGDVRDDHVVSVDVFVLEAGVFHGALDELDDGTGGLHGVAAGTDTTLAVANHRWAGASLALVAASETEGDSSGLAADVGSVGVNAQHLVEVSNGLACGLVLNRTADFETVLDVHVHVGGTGCGQAVTLQELV